MPDPSDHHKGFRSIRDLSHDRTLAAALGDMIIAWADAERVLCDITHWITKAHYPAVMDMFARVPTFEARVKIVQTLIERWTHPGKERDEVSMEVRKLSALSKTRNRWVHGAWVATLDLSITVIFDRRKAAGTPERRRTVKAHDVEQHINAVHDRAWRLIQICRTLRPIQPES